MQYPKQLPAPLPSFARHCEFAPFRLLFPYCAAVLHHGGVGTTTKAVAAGTPQLILPVAFDLVDNAKRVKQLGVGDWLKVKRSVSEEQRSQRAFSAKTRERLCLETGEKVARLKMRGRE